jgi:hypothetical protein
MTNNSFGEKIEILLHTILPAGMAALIPVHPSHEAEN